MAAGGQTVQRAKGSYIAQATHGATAIVNVYQAAPQAPVDAHELAEAEARLAALPLDDVPAPAGLPAGSWMPLTRNALFVGRAPDLRALAATLKAGGTAAVGQAAAVTGLGGIGKSQLACEFVWRYGQYFVGGVFWLSLANPEAVTAEIAACGGPRTLNLHPDFASLPLDGQVGLVASAWRSELPRLLVFDNCENEALLEAWSPRGGGARVLVTARRTVWRPELGVAAVPLDVLARKESFELLRKHRPDLAADDPGLAAIAAELGDLPLALHLAGSYLAKLRHTRFGAPAAYLAAVRRPDLLAHRSLTLGGASPTKHEQHVARTFALSYDQLKPDGPGDALALAVFSRAAWFAPGEPIPRDLLRASAGVAADNEDAVFHFEDALSRLSTLGLLEAQQEGALVLHRLLAAFVRSQAQEAAAARDAVEETVLAEARRLNRAGYPAPLLAWQPHLRAVVEQADSAGSQRAGVLYNELGYHLATVADYPAARDACERALAIDERAFGPDHPDVAIPINNLGLVLQDLGDLPAAREALERALVIDERIFGPDHPNVARDVNNLGLVLHDLGDLAAARAAYERALAIDERAFGPDHPDVAIRINNLGLVLQDLGDLPAARAAYERALAIDEQVYGPDHPNVAISVNNLGRVLHDLGDLPAARQAFRRALAIDERAFGPDHPNVAIRINNLGGVLEDLGDLAAARAAYERALAIDERAFGPDHPSVARDVNNLGNVLLDLGEVTTARRAFERALAIFERVLGCDHPNTRTVRENLEALDRNNREA